MTTSDPSDCPNPSDSSELDSQLGAPAEEDLTAYERWELPTLGAAKAKGNSAWSQPSAKKKNASASAASTRKPPTVDDIEKIRKAAYEEGFESGKTDGYKTGLSQGEAESTKRVDAELAKLSQLMSSLMEPMAKQEVEVEQVLLQLLEKMARQLLRRELSIDSSHVKELVHEALGFFKSGYQVITVYLNTSDENQVRRYLETHPDFNDSWKISAHENLSPGGCIVESSNSLVDASFDSRFSAMMKKLYDKEQSQVLVEENDNHRTIPQSTFNTPVDPPSEIDEQSIEGRHDEGSRDTNELYGDEVCNQSEQESIVGETQEVSGDVTESDDSDSASDTSGLANE